MSSPFRKPHGRPLGGNEKSSDDTDELTPCLVEDSLDILPSFCGDACNMDEELLELGPPLSTDFSFEEYQEVSGYLDYDSDLKPVLKSVAEASEEESSDKIFDSPQFGKRHMEETDEYSLSVDSDKDEEVSALSQVSNNNYEDLAVAGPSWMAIDVTEALPGNSSRNLLHPEDFQSITSNIMDTDDSSEETATASESDVDEKGLLKDVKRQITELNLKKEGIMNKTNLPEKQSKIKQTLKKKSQKMLSLKKMPLKRKLITKKFLKKKARKNQSVKKKQRTEKQRMKKVGKNQAPKKLPKKPPKKHNRGHNGSK